MYLVTFAPPFPPLTCTFSDILLKSVVVPLLLQKQSSLLHWLAAVPHHQSLSLNLVPFEYNAIEAYRGSKITFNEKH